MTREPAEVGSAANSYEILAKLAMGGMAEIFLARGGNAAGVERYVVLKRVLRHRASDVHFVQMFLDEARLAAQLQHPNIAQVYDIGKLGDSYFFTMEYVHGETVRTLLARSHGLRRQIPISAVLSIIAGASAGLHHAHERKGFDGRHLGIVHRDVSPSNLMVGYEGTVKVVDFGVAKAAHRSTETQSGTVKGKISYMSPEQCKGAAEIDRRSDLFSLGIVMWELLTTEKLFRKNSDFETMQAIVSDPVTPPSQLRPDLTPEIDHIVLRLLAKDPAQRFETADELHEAIENVAVHTGSALSAGSLGRYVRELFGQRPEPWIELQAQDQHPEAFTVTSEPIPNNLALSAADEFDRKLAAVPALTQPAPGGRAPTQPPLRVGADLVKTLPLDGDPHDLMRTQPIRDSARMRNVVPLPVEHRPPPLAPMVPTQYTSDSGIIVAPAPSVTPHSTPQYPLATAASHPSYSGMSSYPVAQRPVAQRAHAEETPRRSRAPWIIAPAAVVGVVVGVALGLGGGGAKQPAALAHDESAGTTKTMVATPDRPAEPTNKPAEPTDKAAEPAVRSATPADKPVVGADKPIVAAEKSVESAGKSAAPADKPGESGDKPAAPAAKPAEQVAVTPVASALPPPMPTVPDPPTPSTDAKPAESKAAETKPANAKTAETKPAESKPAESKAADAKSDIATLYKAAQYADVAAACVASPQAVAQNPAACTVAACKTKQLVRAKRWFKQVSDGKRGDVTKACGDVVLVDKPAADPCKTDPMACQH